MPAPTLAVCICTMNRPEDLDRCLASVLSSDRRPEQVIVSDDSDAARAPLTRAAAGRHPGVLYLEGPRRGLSANRNNCLDRVTTDLVSFLDDDSTIDPDFTGRAVDAWVRLAAPSREGRVIVTGQATDPSGPLVPSHLNFLGFYGAKVREGEAPSAVCIGSAVLPMSLFRAIRFDEKITFGTEERDISLHAAHVGYRIVYCPEIVTHQHPSQVNREIYRRDEVTNRVYFGLKRYTLYDRSILKFAAFNVLVLLNAVGHQLKKLQVAEAARAVGCYVKAWRIFLSPDGRRARAGPSSSPR